MGILLMFIIPAGTALAGQGNSGDVWTDNVGQPAGPGHEQDPHLSCSDINIWANGMAASGGSYTVNGWPPSGSQEQVYSSSWSYNQSQGEDQVISVIPVNTLIDNAAANGDAPNNGQGYHFKLEVSQNPAKYKTFWVNCPPPSTPPPPCGSSGGQPCPPPPCEGSSCLPGPPVPPTVVVVNTPPTVVVVPCKCRCHHHAKRTKCPPVKKSQFHLWFRPTQPISHGIVTFHMTAPKSANVRKIVLTIHGHENGHTRSLVFHGRTVIKPINVGNPFYWGITYLQGVDVGTWGHYTVKATFFLKCGKKVVVTTVILNNDPPRGVPVP